MKHLLPGFYPNNRQIVKNVTIGGKGQCIKE